MIRQAIADDFDFIHSLYFHPRVNPFLLYEMDESPQFKNYYFADLLERDLLYVFEKEGARIGMFKLVPLTHRSSHIAYLGGVAIHPHQSGKGYGEQMMHSIIALGKDKGLKRIELSTATTNAKAIRLYEKVGFQQEGILRCYTYLKTENRYLDEVLMAYLF